MMLETFCHSDSAFVTLTYGDNCWPAWRDPSRGMSFDFSTLVPEDLQLWFKRFRKAIAPTRIRYYACGEYGTENERPHFHAIVFGVPSCAFGRSRYTKTRLSCCFNCDQVRDTWGYGRVHLDLVNERTSAYVAGYVAKGLTTRGGRAEAFLKGRHPEFARMSNRPGLGAGSIELMSETLLNNQFARQSIQDAMSVPSVLRCEGKLRPIGRYLKEKLHALALRSGLVLASPGYGPQAEKFKAELRTLWKDTQADSPLYVSLEQAVTRHFQGKRDAFSSRRSLARGRLL